MIPWAVEDAQVAELTLRYEGRLPGGQSESHRKAKNMLRVAFHRQIEHYVATRHDLRQLTTARLPTAILRGEKLEVPGMMPGGFFLVERGGLQFLPLYSQVRSQDLIKVRIEIYRRAWLGGVFNPGGDLDNQAKTILDGLRVPQDDNEAKGIDLRPGERCYALLENDALITAVTIESKQLLQGDAPADHASLMIHVEATPARWVTV